MKRKSSTERYSLYEQTLKPFVCSDSSNIHPGLLKGRMLLQTFCLTCANLLLPVSHALFNCYDSWEYTVTLIMIIQLLLVATVAVYMNYQYCRACAGIVTAFYLMFLYPATDLFPKVYGNLNWVYLLILFMIAVTMIVSRRCLALGFGTLSIMQLILFIKTCGEDVWPGLSIWELLCPQIVHILITVSILLFAHGPWIHYGGIGGVLHNILQLDELESLLKDGGDENAESDCI